MKITIITADGVRFTGKNWENIVIKLKLDMWIPPATKEEYMADVAERVEIFNGYTIKYTNSETFLKELLRIGSIKEIIEGGCKTYYLRKKGGK